MRYILFDNIVNKVSTEAICYGFPHFIVKQKTIQTGDYKSCHDCGQNTVPFKLGVCVCGHQVGQTQYVKDPEKFARTQYLRYDTALEETFAGITEWDSNY